MILEEIVIESKNKLISYIKEKLNNKTEILFDEPIFFPAEVTDDRWITTFITGLKVYNDFIAIIIQVDEEFDEEDISLYSFDEIYKIAQKL